MYCAAFMLSGIIARAKQCVAAQRHHSYTSRRAVATAKRPAPPSPSMMLLLMCRSISLIKSPRALSSPFVTRSSSIGMRSEGRRSW